MLKGWPISAQVWWIILCRQREEEKMKWKELGRQAHWGEDPQFNELQPLQSTSLVFEPNLTSRNILRSRKYLLDMYTHTAGSDSVCSHLPDTGKTGWKGGRWRRGRERRKASSLEGNGGKWEKQKHKRKCTHRHTYTDVHAHTQYTRPQIYSTACQVTHKKLRLKETQFRWS